MSSLPFPLTSHNPEDTYPEEEGLEGRSGMGGDGIIPEAKFTLQAVEIHVNVK